MNEPQPSLPSMTPKQPIIAPWLLITFIIVLLAAGGYIGYYFWNQSQAKTETLTTTAATPATTPSTTTSATPAAETADWKTYTNSTYNFSFKYPKDWKAGSSQLSPNIIQVTANVGYPFTITFTVDVEKNKGTQSYDSLLNIKTNALNKKPNYTKTTTTIDGWPAVELTAGGNGDGVIADILFVKDDNVYLLEGFKQYVANFVDLGKFDQILSTFQFTK